MDNDIKERIIEFNKQFGLKTEFIVDDSILGYAENGTIYINESIEQDYERTNKHELLHFFEDTPEFEDIKTTVLSSIEKHLDQIRAEYELRYFGIYSEDEIAAGVLDNEITIDLLVDNSIIDYKNGLMIGDKALGEIQGGLEERRYLNLSLRKNIQNMNMSDWEKIFIENYYDGKKRTLPQASKTEGIKREDAIRGDIQNYLAQLYELGEEEFKIDPHSPEIIREFENEVNALKTRGQEKRADYLLSHKEISLKELAQHYSEQLYVEYRHIVDQMKETDFEPAFKCLMLRETLTKTYKLEKDEDKRKTIIKKRDMHKSIAGHMTLNHETLKFIYNHAENMQEYGNFANLYFAALEVYNKTIAEHSNISFDGVETYDKGQWIKFEGKESNEDEYLENANRLASLVKDTPWCTKTLASSQLSTGDFFVFVDNENHPHIAVRMEGKGIAEIRGIQNGRQQEIEQEYRDVVLSFLENNQEIQNGKEWLENEEWNKRLAEYSRKIEDGTFSLEDVPNMIQDIRFNGFRQHGNTNKIALMKKLEKVRNIIAEYYECLEEEVCVGNINFRLSDIQKIPYKIIIGDADFRNSSIADLGNLELITGNSIGLSELVFSTESIDDIKKLIDRRNEYGIQGNEIVDLIIATQDADFIKNCIQERRKFGIGFSDMPKLALATNDIEFMKECILHAEEYGIFSSDVVKLLEKIGDSEFIKECIDEREELGINRRDVPNLIVATNDKEYIRKCIDERERMEFSNIELVSLIEATNDPIFIEECIERNEEFELYEEKIMRLLGVLDNSDIIIKCIEQREKYKLKDFHITELIIMTKDSEYIKKCIDRCQELGVNVFEIPKLIFATKDPEYMKRCIDRRFELGLSGDILNELIILINDPEFTKECIERRDELGIRYFTDLIALTEDAEYIEEWIDGRDGLELENWERFEIVKASKNTDCMKKCIERRDEYELSHEQVLELIKIIDDPEYTKECIWRGKELGISPKRIYFMIKEIEDIDFIRNCIDRREELGLSRLDARMLNKLITMPEFIERCEKAKDVHVAPEDVANASEQTKKFEGEMTANIQAKRAKEIIAEQENR